MPNRAIVAAIAAMAMLAAVRIGVAASPSPQPAAPSSPSTAATQPPDLPADIAAAKDLQRKGKVREAIALLEADRKIDPSNRDVTIALAQTYSFAGQQGRAIALLDDLLKAAPDDADARVFLAQAYAFNHDYAAAETQYHMVLAAAPADEDAQVGLAQTFTFEGRFAEARSLFAQVLAHDPKNYDALVGLAGAEGFAGDYQGARSDYRTVLDAQPDNADALIGMATVEFWLNNIPAAVALDNRALAIDPGDSDARDLKRQLSIKTAPQVVATITTSHSNDGSTFDYLLTERYYTAPTTSVGLVQELYQIGSGAVSIQAHRFGFVATYAGSNRFGADLRVVGSRFGGVPQVTDSVFSLAAARGGLAYGAGISTGGVDGSIAANGGQTNPGQQSAVVRINTVFGNASYTQHGSSVNATAQSAYYNDGNRFHEFTLDVSHQFGIGAYNTVTPDVGMRKGGFSNSYNRQAVGSAPGYYDYQSQRDWSVGVTAERQITERFSTGVIGRLGWRSTAIPVYGFYGGPPLYVFSSGTLPFQNVEPYFDYEGDRFSLTAAVYDDHYSGQFPVQPYAATTINLNFTIRLP